MYFHPGPGNRPCGIFVFRRMHLFDTLTFGTRDCKPLQRIMKKSAYAHSALIQNNQFRARIARKECGYFNEVGKNSIFCYKGGK